MQITRTEFNINGATLPAIKISSDSRTASAFIFHGFGGSKEEQLGLGFRLAELGLDAYAIDLRGHGENTQPLDIEVMDDVNTLIKSQKGSLRTITIGHSLGGRLSLLSSADIRIGISPALGTTFSEQTITLVNGMRKHRVHEATENSNFRVLGLLPVVDDIMGSDDLVLFGERDIPDIVQGCQLLASKGKNVVQIPKAMHSDTFLVEATFHHLKEWLFNSGRLPSA